jgi:hypothetical protein
MEGGQMRKGFSLLELIVVTMIIMILLMLFWASVKGVNRLAGNVACANNQFQIGVALYYYLNDHGGLYPGSTRSSGPAYTSGHCLGALYPQYMPTTKIFCCTGEKRTVRKVGNALVGATYIMDAGTNPGADGGIPITPDIERALMVCGGSNAYDCVDNHSYIEGACVLFADNHVESVYADVNPSTMETRLPNPYDEAGDPDIFTDNGNDEAVDADCVPPNDTGG